MQGKVLRTLRNNNSDTGYNATKWDSKDENGNTLKPGVYFYRIETNAGQMESKQMIFLK